MVQQFKSSHRGAPPSKIVLTPQAALALGMKEAYGPIFMGIKVEAAIFSEEAVARPGSGTHLGVFMHGKPEALRSVDLI